SPRPPRLPPPRRQPLRRPRRIRDDVDDDFVDAGFLEQLLADVPDDHVAGRASHRGEGQPYPHHPRPHLDAVDDAEVNQIDRHFGVVDLGERRPDSSLKGPRSGVKKRGESPARHTRTWNLAKLSWKRATISAFRGPRARQRASTSSQVQGSLKSQRFASASKVDGNG